MGYFSSVGIVGDVVAVIVGRARVAVAHRLRVVSVSTAAGCSSRV
jgi:hypothetical protein